MNPLKLDPINRVKLSQQVSIWELEAGRLGAKVVCRWEEQWRKFLFPISMVKVLDSRGRLVAEYTITVDEDNALYGSQCDRTPRVGEVTAHLSAVRKAYRELCEELGIEDRKEAAQ